MARKTKEEAEKTRLQIINAARKVFHECGVTRTSLEKVAQAAGVTRGAVYWHFANKAELFFAMREQVSLPLFDHTDHILFSADNPDPLDALGQSLKEFFRIMLSCPEVLQTFEIMTLRCEYVAEFAPVLAELNRPAKEEFFQKLQTIYRRALEKGGVRAGFDACTLAMETLAFVSGLFHRVMECQERADLLEHIPPLIDAHIALRRAP